VTRWTTWRMARLSRGGRADATRRGGAGRGARTGAGRHRLAGGRRPRDSGTMHVVVTGAAGFIGSHTCERLIAAGHRVTGIDSFDSYLYPSEVKRAVAAELALLPRFTLVEADICDRAAIADVIDTSVDVVCHLAALAGARPSRDEPLRYLRTNIEGTGVILERMRAIDLRRLVFASSSSVYGAKPGADLRQIAAFREDDPCLTPASPYAATKRMNEL